MTIRKSLTAILAAGMLLSQSVRAAAAAPIQQKIMQQAPLQQQALIQQNYAAGAPNAKAVKPMAFGLITNSSQAAVAGAGGLSLVSSTIASTRAKKVGLSVVQLQYSKDNANWSTIRTDYNLFSYNASAHFENGKWYSSRGIGYYRFRVTHYASVNFQEQSLSPIVTNSVKLYY